MDQIFTDLLDAYGLYSSSAHIKKMGNGHIHDTYLVERNGLKTPPLILQRMNNFVFRDIELLMQNMEIITSHIAFKNRKAGKDPAKHGMLLLEAEGGRSWIGNEDTGFWRMFWYIEDQVSFDVAETMPIAFEGGRAIAHFQSMLADLDANNIGESIPKFHNYRWRVEQFHDSLTTAEPTRLKKADELIGFTMDNIPLVQELYELSEASGFPVRLTHNDTKFNNILFDKQGNHTCMIDLDTVMKGYSWFDFGDSLRTCASTAAEDEKDEKTIGFRLDVFENFSKGFLAEAYSFLTAPEVLALHRAPAAFTFMQGLRFLTDYLNGDVYYKISSPEDNFRRARAQYTLMQRIQEREKEMQEIIEKTVLVYS